MAAPAAASNTLDLRLTIGLVGVLIASFTAGLNEYVTANALMDIKGALSIGYDEGTWLTVLYAAAGVIGMAFAPWCSYTFSIRRFTMFAIVAFAFLGWLCPFAPNLESLYALRILQGLMGGCIPPMLMTVALRFLPLDVRLYGLGAYALTATFTPNLALPLAALWTEYAGWEWAFWQAIPLCLICCSAVGYGLPQDPLHLERFRTFDTVGLLTGVPALAALVVGLLQGDKYDWFESPLIGTLLIGGGGLLVAFLLNEWTHPAPFFRLDLLKRRNFTFGLIALVCILVMMSVIIGLPNRYLAELHEYRPLQSAPLTLLVALPQLLALVLVAALCNSPRIDCRWVLVAGALCCAASCLGFSFVTGEWTRENFYLLMALQIVGQPMAIIPILMLATSAVTPAEGVFASSWFNTTRALSSVLGTALVNLLLTERGRFHSDVLVGQLGDSMQVLEAHLSQLQATLPNLGRSELLEVVSRQLQEQVTVLTVADIFLAASSLALLVLALTSILPLRIHPPRSAAPAS
ncbi:drug resistance transporter, EmrB/QacA subfamily [Azotobacter beijerinckii]|uniref:Drug resistance transporter, EmrB/QacA subfamily n=1 Tax=Azotobacter beijerinckii TaxID=170623 RepID=A0A1H9M3I4_9GAMM|nr:MFS transporter [Azotobacter beijerinckii]SER17663.1 drug resistance transporter, EmrB/QacA subfamily [Azotobacter beijerinckii]